MKFLNLRLRRLYEVISYYGLDDDESQNKKDFIILLNRYVVICFLIFVSHSLCNLLFLGITKDSILLFFFSILLFFARFLLNNNVKNRFLISCALVILTCIVTYYSSFCGVESGMYLFYFPLISSLPVFFGFKKDRFLMIFLFIFMLLSFYLSAFTNFTVVQRNPFLGDYDNTLLLLNITGILLLLAVNLFFIYEKRTDYFFVLYRNTLRREQIDHLNSEITRLRKLLNKENFSEQKIEELIRSLQLNDVIFIENFEKLFPDFFLGLQNITSVPLTISDLKFCAMLKLGFSTKQIAIYTGTTIKSVEGKKYRLRKKLKISADYDSKTWMSAL